jgi:hypothetical protein
MSSHLVDLVMHHIDPSIVHLPALTKEFVSRSTSGVMR